jgi:hypothetical protein
MSTQTIKALMENFSESEQQMVNDFGGHIAKLFDLLMLQQSSREISLSFTKLQESMMWFNAHIMNERLQAEAKQKAEEEAAKQAA